MKVMIVVLPVFILVPVRTTIICSKKLDIGTNHNNSNSCGSITTTATSNTNMRNHGSCDGSYNPISTHTSINTNC